MTTLLKRIAFLAILLTIIASPLFGCTNTSQSENTLDEDRSTIRMMLSSTDLQFSSHIYLVESTDNEGKPCIVGEISPELDASLPILVNYYNEDPATTEPVTLEGVRHSLTEGISEAANGPYESPFWEFLLWLKQDADLVYNTALPDPDNPEHLVGETVITNDSNYDHVVNSETANKYYSFRWELEN